MKYRKKPVVVEAMGPINEGSVYDIYDWLTEFDPNEHAAGILADGTAYIDIVTLEGTMHASHGDFVIQGVQGEFYPCRPLIFDQTYEPATTEGET